VTRKWPQRLRLTIFPARKRLDVERPNLPSLAVQIQIEIRNGITILRPDSEIMMTNVMGLRDRISRARSEGGARMLLDMRSVPFMDSSGLGLILSTALAFREAGGDLKLFGAEDKIHKILRLHQLDTKILCYDSVDEAIQSFS